MKTAITDLSFIVLCNPHNNTSTQPTTIANGAIVFEGDQILWVGEQRSLPYSKADLEIISCRGCMAFPGLIDCHTHLVFGGWREKEFKMRILGKSYLEIGQSGGGILSTVRATRAASEEELLAKALKFLDVAASFGVTTVECKSGYGLDLASELKMLRVIKEAGKMHPLDLIPTFLGAHTIPDEYKGKRERYLQMIIKEGIPLVSEEGLAKFVDVYIENGAFTLEEGERICKAGLEAGLGIKIHAEQLSASGAARLGVELGAVSVDHLECLSERDASLLAESNTVCVLLPFASLYTFCAPANGRKLADMGAKIAVATDFNPGSAPSLNLPLAAMLSCTLNRLTPEEAIEGITHKAAMACGLVDRGILAKGKKADIAVFELETPEHLLYNFTDGKARKVIKRGRFIIE